MDLDSKAKRISELRSKISTEIWANRTDEEKVIEKIIEFNKI